MNIVVSGPSRAENFISTKSGHLDSESTHDDTKEDINLNHTFIQKRRIDHLRQACEHENLKEAIYVGEQKQSMYYNKNYNFSFCEVPKCGSTFWHQTFAVLENGIAIEEKVYTMQRISVHSPKVVKKTNISEIDKNTPSVLVSRNPYSRLYSAYIDKSFLTFHSEINCEIRKVSRNNSCPTDVTFQEFSDFVIRTAVSGETIDAHYAPISSLCPPCQRIATYLVKQETFASDAMFILKNFGVEKDKLDIIKSALHDKRILYTIPGIIKTAYKKLRKGDRALPASLLANKLWTSFQIQGYIPDTVNLPLSRFSSEEEYADVNYFIKVVMHTTEEHKLSSDEAEQQRRKAFVNAYREINTNTIDMIREIYKADIEMFDYEDYPPDEY
ncbi:hypothetical protein ACF0H5_005797 [Mactra antiquata]